jgi:hypothetical protein
MKEGRPAYHRRSDLKRLQEHALLVPLVVQDNGSDYVVLAQHSERELVRGRYQVVHVYISGWRDALALA